MQYSNARFIYSKYAMEKAIWLCLLIIALIINRDVKKKIYLCTTTSVCSTQSVKQFRSRCFSGVTLSFCVFSTRWRTCTCVCNFLVGCIKTQLGWAMGVKQSWSGILPAHSCLWWLYWSAVWQSAVSSVWVKQFNGLNHLGGLTLHNTNHLYLRRHSCFLPPLIFKTFIQSVGETPLWVCTITYLLLGFTSRAVME